MMNNKLEDNINNVKSEVLCKIIGQIIVYTLLSIFFGYAGYVFCKDNDYNIMKGIIFGLLLSLVLLKISDKYDFGFITFVIFVVLWIVICSYIPVFVGIIGIFFIISNYISKIINLLNSNLNTINQLYKSKTKSQYTNNNSSFSTNYDNTDSKEDFSEESFYCERCFKKISEEEYEFNDCMCEDCYEDVVANHQDEI